jgi:hypothetical protein
MAAMATTMAAAAAALSMLLLLQDVVLALLDRLGGQHGFELAASRMFVRPFLDSVKHVSVNFQAIISDSWVMERAKDVIDDLIDRDAGVLPGIQNTPITFDQSHNARSESDRCLEDSDGTYGVA